MIDDEKEDSSDEQPTVVVLSSGDLTAEEADAFKRQKEEGKIDYSNFLQNIQWKTSKQSSIRERNYFSIHSQYIFTEFF